MGVYHYIGNPIKKEYLECPFRCAVKWPSNFGLDSCIPRLLAFKIADEVNGWSGDKLLWYNDYDDLPWWDDKTWKDITTQALNDYNECFINPQAKLKEGEDEEWGLLHWFELKVKKNE